MSHPGLVFSASWTATCRTHFARNSHGLDGLISKCYAGCCCLAFTTLSVLYGEWLRLTAVLSQSQKWSKFCGLSPDHHSPAATDFPEPQPFGGLRVSTTHLPGRPRNGWVALFFESTRKTHQVALNMVGKTWSACFGAAAISVRKGAVWVNLWVDTHRWRVLVPLNTKWHWTFWH